MALPLWIILIPLALVFVLYIAFSIVDFIHLFQFGSFTFLSFVVTFCYIGGTAIIAAAAYTALQPIDWNAPLIAFSGFGDVLTNPLP